MDAAGSFSDARRLLKGSKRVITGLVLTQIALVILATAMVAVVAGPESLVGTRVEVAPGLSVRESPGFWSTPMLIRTVVTLVAGAALAGPLHAAALRRAVHLPIDLQALRPHLRFTPTFLVIGAVQMAAFALVDPFSVPSFAVSLVGGPLMAFVGYYVVDRGMGPFEALAAGVSLYFRHLGQSLLLGLIAFGLVLLLPLTLFIALPWLLPLAHIAFAAAFRDAVGVLSAGDPGPIGRASQPSRVA